MFRLVVVFAAVVAVRGQTTPVSQCTYSSSFPLPLNAYIDGCLQTPCELPQLQDAVINVVFKAPRLLTDMSTYATAFLSIFPIPYLLGSNGVTCNFLQNSYCPVLEGEVVQYTLRMYMEAAFPVHTPVTIEFRIQDQNRNPVMCIRVPIVVVEPVSEAVAARGNSTLLEHMTPLHEIIQK